MKQSYLLASSLFLLFSCVACEEDDKMDMDKIDVPNGYALSAGTSTIFLNSSVAYDTNADWITGANSIRFNNGDGLYDDVRTSNNGDGGGLGPVYAGYSCGSCHRNAGRTKPTLWENGGSGNYGFFPCWFISPVATVLSSATMGVYCTIRPSTASNQKVSCPSHTTNRLFLSPTGRLTNYANLITR